MNAKSKKEICTQCANRYMLGSTSDNAAMYFSDNHSLHSAKMIYKVYNKSYGNSLNNIYAFSEEFVAFHPLGQQIYDSQSTSPKYLLGFSSAAILTCTLTAVAFAYAHRIHLAILIILSLFTAIILFLTLSYISYLMNHYSLNNRQYKNYKKIQSSFMGDNKLKLSNNNHVKVYSPKNDCDYYKPLNTVNNCVIEHCLSCGTGYIFIIPKNLAFYKNDKNLHLKSIILRRTNERHSNDNQSVCGMNAIVQKAAGVPYTCGINNALISLSIMIILIIAGVKMHNPIIICLGVASLLLIPSLLHILANTISIFSVKLAGCPNNTSSLAATKRASYIAITLRLTTQAVMLAGGIALGMYGIYILQNPLITAAGMLFATMMLLSIVVSMLPYLYYSNIYDFLIGGEIIESTSDYESNTFKQCFDNAHEVETPQNQDNSWTMVQQTISQKTGKNGNPDLGGPPTAFSLTTNDPCIPELFDITITP